MSSTQQLQGLQFPVNTLAGKHIVRVLNVDSPGKFWVRLHSQRTLYESIVDQMQHCYTNFTKKHTTKLVEGNAVAVLSMMDGKWHRAQMGPVLANGRLRSAFLVDEGRFEYASDRHIKPLIQSFVLNARTAISCKFDMKHFLPDDWSQEKFSILRAMTWGLDFICEFRVRDAIDGFFMVDLFHPVTGTPLQSMIYRFLVYSNMIQASQLPPDCYGTKNKFTRRVRDGHEFKGFFKSFDGKVILVADLDDLAFLDAMEAQIDIEARLLISQTITNVDLAQGDSCLCFYAADNRYHRAEVVGLEPETNLVITRLVDVGVFMKVDRSQCRPIAHDRTIMPEMVHRCQVDGMEAYADKTDEIHKILAQINSDFANQRKVNVNLDTFNTDSQLYNATIIVQTESGPKSIAELVEIYISQYGESTEIAENTADDNTVVRHVLVELPKENLFSLSTDDPPTMIEEDWHFIAKSSNEINDQPLQQEDAGGQVINAESVEVAAAEAVASPQQSEQPVSRQIELPKKAQDLPNTNVIYELNQLKPDKSILVYVSHVRDLGNFYIWPFSKYDDYISFLVDFDGFMNTNGRQNLNANQIESVELFAVVFDSMFWRAKLVKVLGRNRYEVEFVDYGRREEIPLSSIIECPEQFLSQPPCATLCSLNLPKKFQKDPSHGACFKEQCEFHVFRGKAVRLSSRILSHLSLSLFKVMNVDPLKPEMASNYSENQFNEGVTTLLTAMLKKRIAVGSRGSTTLTTPERHATLPPSDANPQRFNFGGPRRQGQKR